MEVTKKEGSEKTGTGTKRNSWKRQIEMRFVMRKLEKSRMDKKTILGIFV
jgi:hypothetical protein